METKKVEEAIKIFNSYFNESFNLRLNQAKDAVEGLAKVIASEMLQAIAETDYDGYLALHDAFCSKCKNGEYSAHSWEDEYEIVIKALLYAAEQLKGRQAK